jgi:hypothetical protein
VSKGRLTRQELGWLLTQEAQGAAERLRKGVQALKTNVPPPPEIIEGQDTTLAALDDAMQMLSNLHNRPVVARGRRGRIDLAALLWEVAPEARVSIEPGGTEVFGDESELRRMLHVLIGHGGATGSAVTLKRDGDFVRVGVALGPDSSATADTERAWLARMAIRYGGAYELEGGMEVLSLPEGNVDERDEKEALRRELDEAKKQGEAYARELAQVVAHGEGEPFSQSSYPPPLQAAPAERFNTLTRLAGGCAAELRALVSPIARDLQELRGMSPHRGSSPDLEGAARGGTMEEKIDGIRRRLLSVQDFVAALAMIGELDVNEAQTQVDLVELARTAIKNLESRAQRNNVAVKLVVSPEGTRAYARLAQRSASTLVRELVAHAIAATTPGQEVTVTVGPGGAGEHENLGSRVIVDDGGTMLPATSRMGLLALEVEPGTYGRPSSIPLFVCAEIVACQGGILELGDSPANGVRVVVTFPR